MSRSERLGLIREIEEHRRSKVITFFLGDRQNLVTAIADDAVRPIYEHMREMGKIDTIELFLYTRGGVGIAPSRIMNLAHEHAKTVNALVPFRCHSGGTVMCCGASKIVMTKMAELSPVDSSTANFFNPADRNGNKIPISVEDVRAYLQLANNSGIRSEDASLEVFKTLSSQVHVLALGNVQRAYNTTVNEIPSLLKYHLDQSKDKQKIDHIVKMLSETYTHDYIITRKEASEIGLPVEPADDRLEDLMWQLYSVYERDLELLRPFTADLPITETRREFCNETAYIESMGKVHAYVARGIITRTPAQQQVTQQGSTPNASVNPAMIPGTPVVRFTQTSWEDVTT